MYDSNLSKAIETIKNIKYINIATVDNHKRPLNTPLFTAYDKRMNFYWLSLEKAEHSQNIQDNPHVFGTIYNSTADSNEAFGVYLEGTVQKITNPIKILHGARLVYDRVQIHKKPLHLFFKNYPKKVYMFRVNRIWINTTRRIHGHNVDHRIEYPIIEFKNFFKNIN